MVAGRERQPFAVICRTISDRIDEVKPQENNRAHPEKMCDPCPVGPETSLHLSRGLPPNSCGRTVCPAAPGAWSPGLLLLGSQVGSIPRPSLCPFLHGERFYFESVV